MRRRGGSASIPPVDKQALVKTILARLEAECDLYDRSARAAHEEATHEQNKAENKYDTRALEASYLAQGQARQAVEAEAARAVFAGMAPRDFGPGDAIDVTALVELESLATPPQRRFYFVASKAGGTEVMHEGHEVLVITPQSPLGNRLQGLMAGERLTLKLGREEQAYRVVSVS